MITYHSTLLWWSDFGHCSKLLQLTRYRNAIMIWVIGSELFISSTAKQVNSCTSWANFRYEKTTQQFNEYVRGPLTYPLNCEVNMPHYMNIYKWGNEIKGKGYFIDKIGKINRTTSDGRRWRLICSIIFCVQSPYPTLLKIGGTCWFTRWYTWMNSLSVIPWIWFTPKPCLSTNMRAILMRWHAFMSQNLQQLSLICVIVAVVTKGVLAQNRKPRIAW